MLSADSVGITESDGAVRVASRSRVIRGVLFDIDGTLYRHRAVRRVMAARLAKRYWRAPRSGASVARVLSTYRRTHEALRQRGTVEDIARAQLDVTAARTGVPADRVSSVVAEWMELRPLDVIASSIRPGLVDTLDVLRGRGLRLGVVGDYPATAKLVALGIANRFDAVVTADDARVQAFKPDPTGLSVALDDLGLDSSETLYVGDRPDVDAPAAAAAGLPCVLVGRRPRRSDPDGGTWISHLPQLLDIVVSPDGLR